MKDPRDLSIDEHRTLLHAALLAVRLTAAEMGHELDDVACAELLDVALQAGLADLEDAAGVARQVH